MQLFISYSFDSPRAQFQGIIIAIYLACLDAFYFSKQGIDYLSFVRWTLGPFWSGGSLINRRESQPPAGLVLGCLHSLLTAQEAFQDCRHNHARVKNSRLPLGLNFVPVRQGQIGFTVNLWRRSGMPVYEISDLASLLRFGLMTLIKITIVLVQFHCVFCCMDCRIFIRFFAFWRLLCTRQGRGNDVCQLIPNIIQFLQI